MAYLREMWAAAKKRAEADAKKSTRADERDVTLEMLKTFTKGLGPKLDALDKSVRAVQAAKDPKTQSARQEQARKLASEAIKIADVYSKGMVRTRSRGVATVYDNLDGYLGDIKKRLGAYWTNPHGTEDRILKR